MYMDVRIGKKEFMFFLVLVVAISVLFIEHKAARITLILSLAGLYFSNKEVIPKKIKKEVVEEERPEMIKHAPTPSLADDPFNTYQDEYLDQSEMARVSYRAYEEYPNEVADHIIPIYDSRSFATDGDDLCAQFSRTMQMRSKEATDNRARFGIESLRPYFEEEMTTTENVPWWGDNDNLFM